MLHFQDRKRKKSEKVMGKQKQFENQQKPDWLKLRFLSQCKRFQNKL